MAETSQNSGSQNNAINYNDPYFISNGDHPKQQLGTHLFNGDNFVNWSRGVRLALGAKNKLSFIDGSLSRPAATSDDCQKWIRNDYLVTSWILHSMESTYSESFIFTNSAKQLWEEIHERYGQSNAPLLYDLHRSLTSIEQGNMSIAEYYAKLKRVWDELQVLDEIPTCKCGAMDACSCGLLKKMLDADQLKKLIQFLARLNPEYD